MIKTLTSLLKDKVLAKLLPWNGKVRYRPEQHYMRGPGPKAKAKDCSTSSREDTCPSHFLTLEDAEAETPRWRPAKTARRD